VEGFGWQAGVGGGETNADNFWCRRTIVLVSDLSFCLVAVLDCEVVAEGFHLGKGVLVVGAVGGGDAVVETIESLFGAA
jgi:hypothetical protein